VSAYPDFTLTGQVALVTGAARGLGRSIALALADAGADIALGLRVPGTADELVAEIESMGRRALAVPMDVLELTQIGPAVDAVVDHFGRLDVLVNNAGVGIGAPMEEIQTKHLDMQLGVNLRALIIGTREGLPMLKEAGAEHGKALIVNTASIAGKGGQAWLSIYAATKAAVINFSQSTHREVGAAGIQCTALAPGFVDTPMTEFVKGQVAAEEMIRPEDLGEAVRFLLRTSPNCHVPEIVFTRPNEGVDSP
jgi:NAD(P)-dependent dehydrogenase (short-subunit alcohol dehydrogenase family)